MLPYTGPAAEPGLMVHGALEGRDDVAVHMARVASVGDVRAAVAAAFALPDEDGDGDGEVGCRQYEWWLRVSGGTDTRLLDAAQRFEACLADAAVCTDGSSSRSWWVEVVATRASVARCRLVSLHAVPLPPPAAERAGGVEFLLKAVAAFWAHVEGGRADTAALFAASGWVPRAAVGDALCRAVKKGEHVLARALVRDAGVDPNVSSSSFGLRPVMYAASQPEGWQTIDILCDLSSDVDCDAEDIGGQTAVTWAARCGQPAACRRLLARGAAADRPSNDGMTPLMWAAAYNHVAVARLLLAARADAAAVDRRGMTPLHWAGGADVAALLLRHGAPLMTRDAAGATFLSNPCAARALWTVGTGWVRAVLRRAAADLMTRFLPVSS